MRQTRPSSPSPLVGEGGGEGAGPVHPHLSPPPSRGRIVGKIFMFGGDEPVMQKFILDLRFEIWNLREILGIISRATSEGQEILEWTRFPPEFFARYIASSADLTNPSRSKWSLYSDRPMLTVM